MTSKKQIMCENKAIKNLPGQLGNDIMTTQSNLEINKYCAICVQFQGKETTNSLTTFLDNSTQVYEFLETMSKFQYMVNGLQLVCASCFNKILNAFELQKMCNQLFEQFTNQYEKLYIQNNDINYKHKLEVNNSDDVIENKYKVDIEETRVEVFNYESEPEHDEDIVSVNEFNINCEIDNGSDNDINKNDNPDEIVHDMKFNNQSDNEASKQEIIVLTTPDGYQCSLCLKLFPKEKNAKVHLKLHREKNYMCDTCGKNFVTANYLKLHQQVHSDNRPYKCNNCPNTYKGKKDLERHSLIHSGRKPYSCPQCDYRSRHKSTMNSHIQSKHTGSDKVFRFKCDVCPKEFTRSSKLKIHTRVHTGEKPYVCSYCDSRFTQRYYWTVHEAKHIEKEKS